MNAHHFIVFAWHAHKEREMLVEEVSYSCYVSYVDCGKW